MKSKQILNHLLWLLVIAVCSSIFGYTVSGIIIGNTALDMQLHGIPNGTFLLHLNITFLVFFGMCIVKVVRNRYSLNFFNWSCIIIGIISMILLNHTSEIFFGLSSEGWTSYPPLSQLGSKESHDFQLNPIFSFISDLALFLNIVTLTLVLMVAIRWRRVKIAVSGSKQF